MNGLADFVAGGFPLPWNPVLADSGIGEFVLGGFPLPQNPVGVRASVNGSLPKAPPIPMALIGHGNGADLIGDDDCGMGCGCGMGDLSASLPSFLQGSSTWPIIGDVSNLYVALGVAALLFFVGAPFVGGGRRRR